MEVEKSKLSINNVQSVFKQRAIDGIESNDFTKEEADILKNILGSMNLSYPKKNNLKGGYKKRKSTKKSKKSNKSKNDKKNKKSKLRKIKVY